MANRSLSIVLLVLMSLSSNSCLFGGSTAPEEEGCDSGRELVHSNIVRLSKETPELYFATTKAVDINCHGKFLFKVIYERPEHSKDLTLPPPALDISFGTDFVFGAGFAVDTTIELGRDQDFDQYKIFVYTADQGAKNLNASSDWLYTFYAKLVDTSRPVLILKSEIDYKAKKKS